MTDEALPTPRQNRLSDAPSAATITEDREVRFFRDSVHLDDLSMVFQPIVRVDDGKLFAYEALLRCPNLAPHGLFAEATARRSAGRLGRMAREVAVALCSDAPLFLNLHAGELEEGWIFRDDDPIFHHDRDVYLEITESVPATHADLCTALFHELRGRTGVYLAVDDLGAGVANLNLIVDLEPKTVKLDRRCVRDLGHRPRQQVFVASLVRLCANLGAEVVAEGIETREELSAIRDCGVAYAQGFLLARPSFPTSSITWPPSAGADESPEPTVVEGPLRGSS